MMGTESGQEETSFLIYLREKPTMYLLPTHRATCRITENKHLSLAGEDLCTQVSIDLQNSSRCRTEIKYSFFLEIDVVKESATLISSSHYNIRVGKSGVILSISALVRQLSSMHSG